MSAKTGHNLYLYYNSATNASPTWVQIAQVEDVNVDQLAWDTAELTRRASRFVLEIATVMRIGCMFKLWHGLGATVFDAIRTAFFARTATIFAIANGPIATAGTEYLKLPALVKEFPWNQPLREVSSHDVRIVPTYFEESSAEVEPSWNEVSA